MENEKKRNRRTPGNSYDSVLEQIDILIKQLESIRTKAVADYNEIKDLLGDGADGADRLQLETIRANCLKTLENFFKMRIQIINIQLNVVKNSNKKSSQEDGGHDILSDNEKNELEAMAAKLRESIWKK